ncbi:enoyl-CoA hydratase/isomerase family protein [Frankia sp. CNm7]|uniref:Enoyl-CoA hydratase/isomerase family protein n=1 Tax=Frankia nepalensis TaxID=1836974 RepID=A0A937ULE2_9ACTN|nr:enoyl-CoA hydratase-related protein [Frankia nepalensis]MBL7501845.1 enoyl-CoA hydratase/isomerase family protein [Frankia nepalensis]MBL7515021.1 enoyl-CoA hydratase/isomerase family protein [Frankia nepalensis]MBL7518731.1 enoyl-CoA hydratase/isomerase family protein [Frankia nepalensis]MBL7625933.1 enoyl-CoA hydratase/isomerase family protein [Frankia nepalensis]
MTVDGGDLRVELAGAVLILTIDREARRNALNDAVLEGMRAALAAPPEAARVVLVRSVGDRVFCAGADLAVMDNSEVTGLELHETRGGVRRVVEAMRDCPLPVVARVQGLCLAGGTAIAMGADIVVAAETAAFGLPEIDRGLWPFMVSALLTRHVSPKIAMDLMLTGRRVGAAEARELGLVSRVVPAADLDKEVDELVGALAAKAPVAVRLGKAAFVAASDTPSLPLALTAMQAQLSLLTQTADAAEGVAAFFEKRQPRWTGR